MSLLSKKRKLSDEASLPSIDVTSPKTPPAPRKDSGASGTSDDTAAMALKALSALDAHGRNPLKKRKASLDSSMESDQALGLAPLGAPAEQPGNTQTTDKEATPPKSNKGSGTALDHLDALGEQKGKGAEVLIGDEPSGGSGTLASSNQRVMMDALLSSASGGGSNTTARRDRLESWGGMSDLSATGFGGDGRLGDAAAALAASALQYTGLIEDITAAAHPRTNSLGSHSSGEFDSKPSAIPSRILLGRDRRMSVASEFSLLGEGGEQVSSSTLQAFLDAAMATVGDQLEDLAGAVEMAASGTDIASISSEYYRKEGVDSDVSSTVSPLIGAASDFAAARGRPRSTSASSKPLSVDYDAVAAAVNAAQAATGPLDLSTIAGGAPPPPVPSIVVSNTAACASQKEEKKGIASKQSKDMEAIRARARAAAGYVPPDAKKTPESRPPLKKRPKHSAPEKPPAVAAASYPDVTESTPRISNVTRELVNNPGAPFPPLTVSSEATAANSKAANQKWDEMFECLVQFAEEQKAKACEGLSEKEKAEWEWDGNVPTTYKTPDGKALGRWVNNQRSGKTKGILRPDREDRLVSTGLRWSVVATNTWQDMMNELLLYIEEKTKDGQEWDGNVPTNHKIKQKGTGEDKNLGRWVNRQRSAKQCGKLRKDRQEQLEAAGLRWSVLSTSSWDDMYQVLCDYVKQRKDTDPNNSWDGNVPANYKTNDEPPKALGRWVNRQRSNYGQKKIKTEHIDKLNAVGLKWAVHDRSRYQQSPPPSKQAIEPNTVSSIHVPVSSDNKEIPGSSGAVSNTPVVIPKEKKDASGSAQSKVSSTNKEVSNSDSSTNAAVSTSKRVANRRKLPCRQSRK